MGYTDITALSPEEKMMRWNQLNSTPGENSYLSYSPNNISAPLQSATKINTPNLDFGSMIQGQVPSYSLLAPSKSLPKVIDTPATPTKKANLDNYGNPLPVIGAVSATTTPAPVASISKAMPTSALAKQAYDYYVTKRGLPTHVAAGIVGNLQRESDLKTSAIGDNGAAHGLAQWSNNGGRWNNMQAWAKSKGRDPMDFTTQLDYVLDEPGEQNAIKATMGTTNIHDAVMTFANKFERPNKNPSSARYDLREAYANSLK